jgi:hypothetical protein
MAFYSTLDRSIFAYALSRLEQRKAELDAQIDSINRQLGRELTPGAGGHSSPDEAVAAPAARKQRRKSRRKSTMSAEGKARIAAAQRKRWAAKKAAEGAPGASAQKAAPRKARFTPEVRKRLAEAMKRRWAAKRAASAAKKATPDKAAAKSA